MTAAVILILLFLAGLLLNAFCAGYETGFVSCNPIRVRHLAEKERDPRAMHMMAYQAQPDRMLTVVLIGTNIGLIIGTIAITRQVGDVWAPLIATPAFLLFGEIIPKSMFRLHPTRLSLFLMPVIRFFDVLFAPLAVPVTWMSQRLLSLFRMEYSGVRLLMRSVEDMRILVDESASHGAIEPEEQEMIHSVMDLQTKHAKEVMVPRIDIQALPDTATKSELIALLQDSGRTRIPVFHENIDRIVGVANAFELLRDDEPEREDIGRFVKDIMHVHDTMKLDDVLKAMRDNRQTMAVVIDEYGGTDGLITLEDILEEIFGEIRDEYDKEAPLIRKVAENDYVIEARMPLEEAAEAMAVPIVDEEVETVGGWVMHLFARIPQKGEVSTHGTFRITVLDGGENFISTIRLEILPEEAQYGEE